MTFKFLGYLALVIICSPVAWVMRPHKDYEGEMFSEYDDDDLGEDVDPDEVP